MDNRKLKKQREAAAKLSRPRPVELPSGKWRCQIMVSGRRIDVMEDDPAIAHAKALALKAGLMEEEHKRDRSSPTLSEAIDRYIAMKEGALSPSTVRGYKTIQAHRFRDLMSKRIDCIEKSDVQAAISKEVQLVSAKTIYNSYGLIRPVLKDNGIDVFGIKLPQKIKPNKRYLQPEDIGKLIQAAEGDSCEAAILMAAWLGLRRSEIIGLCWDAVDFEHSTITIKRTIVPDKNNQWVLKEGAKNESSQRTISCPEYIMQKLKEKYSPGKSGQIFRIHPDTLRRHIHKICQKAGIQDTTVHGLRHTNAAVMKSLGIDDAHAMARGGWTNESTYKKTYAYVFEQTATEADKEINEYFQNLHTKLHTDK